MKFSVGDILLMRDTNFLILILEKLYDDRDDVFYYTAASNIQGRDNNEKTLAFTDYLVKEWHFEKIGTL